MQLMKGMGIIICTSLCMLVAFFVTVTAADGHVEYERNGSCNFTQECVYKYSAVQYSHNEKDREKLSLSTDVHWHCESSGIYDGVPANEYCFTLFDTTITISSDDINSTFSYTSDGQQNITEFLADELKGELCYVQTSDGKIVAIHYGMTDSYDGINIKRSIVSVFQANFDGNKQDVKETDQGSIHTSHYSFNKTSSHVVMFSRDVLTNDLIEMANGADKDSLVYIKHEESVFVNKILQRSRGTLKLKLNFAGNQNEPHLPNNAEDIDKNMDFGKEFETNGSYLIEKAYCKWRAKRNMIFANLKASDVEKATLLATIDVAKFDQKRIRKMRDTMSSVPKLLELLRRNPNSTTLVESFKQLLMLEAKYGAPSQYTPAISELIEYYKKIQLSKKPQDVEIKKLIYEFLSADSGPQSQRILASLLTKSLSEDERDALLHQLSQITNAVPELVDTIININPSNDDSLLLILGALARNNDAAIQSKVVDELIRRLEAAKSNGNSSEDIVTISYALGNTGSRLAINALLSNLDHDDLDTQVAVIRSLDVHLDQPAVQQALITFLATITEDKVLEEVLMILKDGFNNKVFRNPNEDMLKAIVNATIRLENPNLYELLIEYLTVVGTDEAVRNINKIMQQYNYGEVMDEYTGGDSRVRRQWDSTNSFYNLVASYYDRRSDVRTYPRYKSYLMGRNYGINKLYLQVGAGTFAGTYCSGSTKRLKLYNKVAARAIVLGNTLEVARMEYSDRTSGSWRYHRIYVKLGSTVRTNLYKTTYVSCTSSSGNWWYKSGSVFTFRYSYYVVVATINFYVYGSVITRGDGGMCMCPARLSACAEITPSVTLRVTGGASVNLAHLVRGGIDVSVEFVFYLQPQACIQQSYGCGTNICLNLYYGRPSYLNIEPWYQTRTIRRWRIRWGDRRVWNPVRWRLSGSRTLQWSSCNPYVRPCNP